MMLVFQPPNRLMMVASPGSFSCSVWYCQYPASAIGLVGVVGSLLLIFSVPYHVPPAAASERPLVVTVSLAWLSVCDGSLVAVNFTCSLKLACGANTSGVLGALTRAKGPLIVKDLMVSDEPPSL